MRNLAIISGLLLLAALAQASDAAHGGGHGLDAHAIKTIIYQIINVSIMIGGLFYIMKKPVKDFFKGRREAYLHAAGRAQAARAKAEEEHLDIKVKLTKLESTADESISRAKAEAADLRSSIMAEAEELSKRIRKEAEAAAQLEIEKAKTHLREDMIREAAKLAAHNMQSSVTSEDHKRLQSEFINNIQAVQQ
ncbi:MAG: hypothetical protein BroJett040_09250 [Oligoflexia bacterium]|nr:MAG: hypothetical protein BroJett040_09250 [Oligoflexia bacterium]